MTPRSSSHVFAVAILPRFMAYPSNLQTTSETRTTTLAVAASSGLAAGIAMPRHSWLRRFEIACIKSTAAYRAHLGRIKGV